MESPIQWETAYTSCCVTQGFISQRFVSLAVTVIHNSYNTSYRCNCCSVLKRYELKNENKKTFKKLEISLIKKIPFIPSFFQLSLLKNLPYVVTTQLFVLKSHCACSWSSRVHTVCEETPSRFPYFHIPCIRIGILIQNNLMGAALKPSRWEGCVDNS